MLFSTRTSGGDEQETSTDGGRSSGGRLRKLLLAAGLLAFGYVVTRRARTGDLREKAGEALPGNGSKIPIGDTGTESDEPTLGIGATEEDVRSREEPDRSETGGGPGQSDESTTDTDVESAVREVDGDEEGS